MAYFAPFIDQSGIHIPTYTDIRDELIQQAKSLFGQDIYLGNDSQDYQWISVVADKINDTMQAIQFAYNSRGPGTAIGSGLDILVKLNGIARNTATYSTAVVTLTGISNTIINNGVVQDVSGYKWNLPSSVTIGTGGTVNAQVTSQLPGPILANAGEITTILTPTYGWSSVTNATAATPGAATETDAQLRARQAISTAQPSLTVLEGTKGAIAAVSGVTRFIVYENDTNVVDTNGLPAHSITAVVEGGEDADIAQTIFNKKGSGSYTNGTTSVNITDKYGQVFPIRFYRPAYVDIEVTVNIKQLAGYTSQDSSNIKAVVTSFLNSLAIGDSLPISSLWGAALSALTNLNKPTFSVTSITAAKFGEAQGTADIPIAFNEVTRGNLVYITVNVT